MQLKPKSTMQVERRALRHAEHAIRRVESPGSPFYSIYFQFYFHAFEVFFQML